MSTREILAELPALAQEIAAGAFSIDAQPMPLAAVEKAWTEASHATRRIVLTP